MRGPIARWLLVGLLAASGSACTTVLPPERTEALGPPFNEALKEGYLQLAASRWQEGSWELLHFRDKARQAMLGDAVWPDDVSRVPDGPAAGVGRAARSSPGRSRCRRADSWRRHDAALAQVSFDAGCPRPGDPGPRLGVPGKLRRRARGDRTGRGRHLAGDLCRAVRAGQRRGGCRRAERRDRGVARGAAAGPGAHQRDRLCRPDRVRRAERGAVIATRRERSGGAGASGRIPD